MGRWLFFSSGFHCLAIIFVILFSGISVPFQKKQKKVFYVDFVGSSIVANAGSQKSSSAGGGKENLAVPEEKKENSAKTDKKSDSSKEEIKVQKEKKASNTKSAAKQADKQSPAAKKSSKPAKKTASKADYLEAEDFSGDLPPPSMASASGFLPEKTTAKSVGGNGGEVSEGIGGGGFRTDTDFPYPWYISQVREALFNAWAANSPSVAGLQCTAGFTILRNGSTKNAKIEKSSGNRLFDSAALAAVRAAAPFGRLPDDFYEDVLTIHVEFRSDD